MYAVLFNRSLQVRTTKFDIACECALLRLLTCLKIIPIGAILGSEYALLSPLTSFRIIPVGPILTGECALLKRFTFFKNNTHNRNADL